MAEYFWNLRDILTFLNRHNMSITVQNGAAQLHKHTAPEWAVKQLMPHLIARKSEILEEFKRMAEPETINREEVMKVITYRAKERRIWFLRPVPIKGELLHGMPEKLGDKPNKGKIPPDARYVSVSGDEFWTDLDTGQLALPFSNPVKHDTQNEEAETGIATGIS